MFLRTTFPKKRKRKYLNGTKSMETSGLKSQSISPAGKYFLLEVGQLHQELFLLAKKKAREKDQQTAQKDKSW